MKRVLVTGGAGFIGSHLVERLVKEGNDVICLDNFFTGSLQNVQEIDGFPKVKVVTHDVIEPFFYEIDRMYHLASPASPKAYQRDPLFTIKTNVLGVLNALELARKIGARVLQASTSEVYGDPLEHPQRERYWGNVNPIGKRACYDEAKRVAETMCVEYTRSHNVDVRIVRIFNTYGPRMAIDDGRVVSNFIAQALRGENVTLYGDGAQTRSFQYIDDLVEGMIRMMENDKEFHGPVNLGNPTEYSIKELAEKIIALTGSKSKIVYQEIPEDDPIRRKPDISLAKKMLGWEPKVSLEEGLKKTITYFRTKINQ